MKKLSDGCIAKAKMMTANMCMVSVRLAIRSEEMLDAQNSKLVEIDSEVMAANEILRKIHTALYGGIIAELKDLRLVLMAENDRESVGRVGKLLTMIYDAEGSIESVEMMEATNGDTVTA